MLYWMLTGSYATRRKDGDLDGLPASARRLVERERALSDDVALGRFAAQQALRGEQRRRRWRTLRTLIYGMILGVAALFAYVLYTTPAP